MRISALYIVLVGLSVAVLMLSVMLGPTDMGWSRTAAAFFGLGTSTDEVIVHEIRLPRALAAYLVGALLGLSGAALQGLLRNPLAEPGVLGVSATSALLATFSIYYGLTALGGFFLPLSAIIGALAATFFLAMVAVRITSVVPLILIGVGLTSFSGALMSLLMNLAPNPFSLSDMLNWMMGSVANRSIDDLLLASPFAIAGATFLLHSRHSLTVLTLGESVAGTLGVNLSRVRIVIVLGAGLCTGAAVSIAGAVGFVGIVAPHLIRRYVDYDAGRTLVPAALLAGCILVAADTLIRILPTPVELKLGVVAALLGAPVFILIAAQRMRQADD